LSLYKNKKVNKNTHIFNRTECIWTNYSSCSDKVIRDSLWSGQKEILTFFAVIGILAFILSGKSTTAVTAPPVPPVTAHNMVALSPVLYDSAASTSDSSDYLSCSDKQIIKAMPKFLTDTYQLTVEDYLSFRSEAYLDKGTNEFLNCAVEVVEKHKNHVFRYRANVTSNHYLYIYGLLYSRSPSK